MRTSNGATSASNETLPREDSSIVLQRHEVVDDRYVVERELGRGGMAVVYLAHDETIGRRVALKLVSLPGVDTERSIEYVAHEAKALGALRNSHVVSVYTAGTHEGAPYLAMEYVRGVSLESIVEAHRRRCDRMPLCRALTILVEVAQGLAAVHAAGLVHRDIKPGNVVIEAESSRTVIVDFGLAEMRGREAISAGTPQYCAPEQFLGRTAAPTSDVYAFGVLAFELLTGRPPFEGNTISEMLEKHLLSDAPRLSALVPELGPLDHIVARALEKSPSARYQRAEQLAHDLLIARDTLFPPTSKRKPIATKLVERVLIADADANVRAVARRAVEEAFFWNPVEISLADTVNAATIQAFDAQPGLILLGHDPKRFDGLAMFTALRSTTGGDRARVIIMADDATLAATRVRFGCLGVRDFLSTPLALRRVVEVIREATHRSGLFAAMNQDTALSEGRRQ